MPLCTPSLENLDMELNKERDMKALWMAMNGKISTNYENYLYGKCAFGLHNIYPFAIIPSPQTQK
jgi:hypothetical protein